MRKSILTDHVVKYTNPPEYSNPNLAKYNIDWFNELISNFGYHCTIEHALRCPCVDRNTGAALSTCHNCLGRGWIFTDKRDTTLIVQGMSNIRKNTNTGEINRGMARITGRATDGKLNIMDRIVVLDLQAEHTQILRPTKYKTELSAYPVYEPLEIIDMFMYQGEDMKLLPLTKDQYTINGNKILFSEDLLNFVDVTDINQKQPDIAITCRYTYHPVYHIVEANRELMRARQRACGYDNNNPGPLIDMPFSYTARKAHYIFDAQKYDDELLDNVMPDE